jgi:hypothetical protein
MSEPLAVHVYREAKKRVSSRRRAFWLVENVTTPDRVGSRLKKEAY